MEPTDKKHTKKILWALVPLGMGILIAHFFFSVTSIIPVRINTRRPPAAAAHDVITPIITTIIDTTENIFTVPKTKGVTMFRGNPTRTSYGTGPVPSSPKTLWKYGTPPLCKESTVFGITTEWCGIGWTGQPVVWEHDETTEVIFGAYDGAVHFLDGATGEEVRPSFQTDDIIKGSVTLDPDGFPLLYFGSRDNKYRILALDHDAPTEIWSINANISHGVWNNDWDSNGVIVDGILYEGGENGWIYAIKLNRAYDALGKVSVAPEIVWSTPTYDDSLIASVGRNVSVENSPAVFKDRLYIANSGGRILGFDISHITDGVAPIVFDFWAGDDIDATIIIDNDGMLYVGTEEERLNERSKEVGQFMKLDPYTKGNPILWSMPIPAHEKILGGIWATPALDGNHVYAATNPGDLLVVRTDTGTITQKIFIGEHAWSSPVIIDSTLIVGTCSGQLKAFDIKNDGTLTESWKHSLPGCIESTPAIWNGMIYVGARDGKFYGIGEK